MDPIKFAEVMTWLSTATGRAIGESEVERRARLDVYYDCLGDLPIEVLQIAAKRVAMSHPWSTFPTVAELRQAAAETILGETNTMTGAEAWELAWRAACKIDPESEGSTERHTRELPSLVLDAMRAFGISALITARPNFARPEFMKIYDGLAARNNRRVLLPSAIVNTPMMADSKSPAIKAIAGKIGLEKTA